MSYCRFSSDNWRSDVYVYGAAEGIVIHMASNRPVGEIPKGPPWEMINTDPQQFADLYNAQLAWLGECEREAIDLPHAGQSFYGLTEAEAADLLDEMKAHGYHIPDGVIEELREEARETERAEDQESAKNLVPDVRKDRAD